jgi:aerobic carbon-monoxide dehydrogenase medium subunit
MIPAHFDYEVASSVEHATELLGQDAESRVLAGGQSLLPLVKLRFARPSLLIDIGPLRELSYVREEQGHIAIGGLTRHHDLATNQVLRDACPIIGEVASRVGDPQVRHRGTIGGSVAHADPASDLATVLLCLDAQFVAHGRGAQRVIPAKEFFVGYFDTALEHDEILTEIRVPRVRQGRYLKFQLRARDWAVVGVAVASVNGEAAHVGLANMGPKPLRASGVEEALRASEGPSASAARAVEGTSPVTDTYATAEYRNELSVIMVRRLLEEHVGESPQAG